MLSGRVKRAVTQTILSAAISAAQHCLPVIDNLVCGLRLAGRIACVTSYAAFFAGCAFLAPDLAVVFFFAPLSSRLFCKTETRSMTLVGLGAFLGFSSISFPPASTF